MHILYLILLSINLRFARLKSFMSLLSVVFYLVHQHLYLLLLCCHVFAHFLLEIIVQFICLSNFISHIFDLFIKMLNLINSPLKHLFCSSYEVSHRFVSFFVFLSNTINFLFHNWQPLAKRDNVFYSLNNTFYLKLLFLYPSLVCSYFLIDAVNLFSEVFSCVVKITKQLLEYFPRRSLNKKLLKVCPWCN